MSTRTQRESLKAQLVETRRIKELVSSHPLMSFALSERENDLRTAIESLPLGQKEPRTVLFFSGGPVEGSHGIDAAFAGRVLEPFQNMVIADYSDRWHGTVGSRGRRSGENQSRLLLTGLPRGSFGLELTKADNDELFEETQLADTLAHVTRLVESAVRSDEDFATALDETAPRVIQNLRVFLDVISKGNAGLRMESGDFQCSMDPSQASEAFKRVADTTTTDEVISIAGVFKGVLLSSWKYDFTTDDEKSISGRLDDSLTEEQIVRFNRDFFNQSCIANLNKTTAIFKGGRVRTTYTLKGLEPLRPSA